MPDISKPVKDQFQTQDPSTKELLEVITEALLERKGQNISLLDVSELTTLTEFFVVCHGTSDTQIKALADNVMEKAKEELNEKVWKREGFEGRAWIILDFVNIVVHVMSEQKREFYGIERMWNDATITRIEDE